MNMAIGLIELNSIAKGMEVGDAMLKATDVELLTIQSVCPGKYIILISGGIADIRSSMAAGNEIASGFLVDQLIIPNVDSNIFPAITSTGNVRPINALGVIETFSVASTIIAADAAIKAADVDLIEIRLAQGIGGKSYVTMTGDVGAVKEAVSSGCDSIMEKGIIVNHVVIPSPHEKLAENLL